MSIQEPYRILACVGPDAADDVIYAEAIDVALRHLTAEVHVAHVVEDRVPADTPEGFRLLEQRLEVAPTKLRARLQRIVDSATNAPFVHPVIAHMLVGDPARALVQAAIDVQADLIVVGTRRIRGIERLLLGSVSAEVIRDAHCSVLVATGKNYSGLKRSRRPDPPCEACVAARAQSRGARYWCEIHARPHVTTHVIEPTERMSQRAQPTGLRIV